MGIVGYPPLLQISTALPCPPFPYIHPPYLRLALFLFLSLARLHWLSNDAELTIQRGRRNRASGTYGTPLHAIDLHMYSRSLANM